MSTLRSLPVFAVKFTVRWPDGHQVKWQVATPTPGMVDVFKLSRFVAMGGPNICYMFIFLFALDFFALPPQGSHPVPQPAAETGARHLQVGLAGSQKVDFLSCLVVFFPVTLGYLLGISKTQISPSCAVSAHRTVE